MNYSIEKERYVIGAIFHKPSLLSKIQKHLKVDDFYDSVSKNIFDKILDRSRKDFPIDVLSFQEFSLEIVSGMNSVASTDTAIYYAKELHALGKKRRIHKSVAEMKEKIEAGDDIASSLENFQQALSEKEADGKTGKELVVCFETEQIAITDRIKSGEKYIGMASGFSMLDGAIDGIRPGHFWVVGGYTSTGKSYFAINIMRELVEQKKRILFYSLEMSSEEIGSRLIGLISGVNATSAQKGNMNNDERDRVEWAKQSVHESDIKIFDSKRSIDDIRSSIISEHVDKPVDCVFIDYLQLLTGRANESQYDVLRKASSELQSVSKVTKIPIISLSQINNDTAKVETEMIGFKGAGDIAASADFGLEIRLDEINVEEMRQKQSRGEPISMKVIIKKNRQGPKLTSNMFFNSLCGKFTEKHL